MEVDWIVYRMDGLVTFDVMRHRLEETAESHRHPPKCPPRPPGSPVASSIDGPSASGPPKRPGKPPPIPLRPDLGEGNVEDSHSECVDTAPTGNGTLKEQPQPIVMWVWISCYCKTIPSYMAINILGFYMGDFQSSRRWGITTSQIFKVAQGLSWVLIMGGPILEGSICGILQTVLNTVL